MNGQECLSLMDYLSLYWWKVTNIRFTIRSYSLKIIIKIVLKSHFFMFRGYRGPYITPDVKTIYRLTR